MRDMKRQKLANLRHVPATNRSPHTYICRACRLYDDTPEKLAKWRARSFGFLERVVVTPRAWHAPAGRQGTPSMARAGRPAGRAYVPTVRCVRSYALPHSDTQTSRRATKPGSHLSIGRFERICAVVGRQPTAPHMYRPGTSSLRRHTWKSSQKDAHGHSSTCTSDLHRSRVCLSRLSPPTETGGRTAGPSRARPRRAAGPRRAVTGGQASARDRRPGVGTRPAAGLRHANGPGIGKRPAATLRHTTGSCFGTRPGLGTRPGQASARRFLNWSHVDGSDLVVFSQLSKSWQNDAHGHLVSSRET